MVKQILKYSFGILLTALLLIKWNQSEFHDVEQLPVMHEGRIKPFYAVMKDELLMLQGRYRIRDGNDQVTLQDWFFKLVTHHSSSDDLPVIRIDHPGLIQALKFNQKKQIIRVSINQLKPHLPFLEEQAELFEKVKDPDRNTYQKALLTLVSRIHQYHEIKFSFALSKDYLLTDQKRVFDYYISKKLSHSIENAQTNTPNNPDFENFLIQVKGFDYLASMARFMPILEFEDPENPHFHSYGDAMLKRISSNKNELMLSTYANLLDMYRVNNSDQMNQTAREALNTLKIEQPDLMQKVTLEYWYHKARLFNKSYICYFLAFILVFLSWLFRNRHLRTVAFLLVGIGFGVQTIGLITRMVIQGRPPITNLYSTAVFVGWGAILIGILIERINKKGIGILTGAVTGLITLFISHRLSMTGDTMEALQAVLDTNFWLATHVILMNVSYSGAVLGGVLAHIVLFKWLFSKNYEPDKLLNKMIYGCVAFTVVFAFIGTVLGGFWADVSWGRFWGWDPKENGALLIVLWYGIILHMRLAGWLNTRMLVVMTILGNCVVSFSWFGVNLLGVGLHSYGFMSQGKLWLLIFNFVEAIMCWLCFFPKKTALK